MCICWCYRSFSTGQNDMHLRNSQGNDPSSQAQRARRTETPVFGELAECNAIWRCYSICLFNYAVRISSTIQGEKNRRARTRIWRNQALPRHFPCEANEGRSQYRDMNPWTPHHNTMAPYTWQRQSVQTIPYSNKQGLFLDKFQYPRFS
jgi:hypothetical protein